MSEHKPDHVIGLDLGQQQDYTALAVLERSWQPDAVERKRLRSHYAVRHIQRWPLGTSYTQIVTDVGGLLETLPLHHPRLVVDQTGVGAAVVDMFRQARLPVWLRAVLITSGHTVSCDGAWHVPKKELVSTLQVLLQARRFKIANLPDRDLLVNELLAFRVKVTVNANETFESWRERDHDDLVLAVALATWVAEREGVAGFSSGAVPNAPRGIPSDRTWRTEEERREMRRRLLGRR